ncbi:hypothetical protein Hanom_Chr06g00481931 [Helianthus anomalus]
MTSSSTRKAKRSKTSSSLDPKTSISDARNVDLNINVDDKDEEVDSVRLPDRRSGKRGRAESSSAGFEMKQDFEEMNDAYKTYDTSIIGIW